jgi:hypothetical protein
MSNFTIYIIGTLGLALAAYKLDTPPIWIGIGCCIAVGMGIMMGVLKTRQKD